MLVQSGVLPDNLSLAYFKITDANYGQTGDIFQCVQCGFRQCTALVGMLNYYREMEDEEYEETRVGRAVQAR